MLTVTPCHVVSQYSIPAADQARRRQSVEGAVVLRVEELPLVSSRNYN